MSFLPILICYYVLSFNIYHHFFDEKWSLWGLRHSLSNSAFTSKAHALRLFGSVEPIDCDDVW